MSRSDDNSVQSAWSKQSDQSPDLDPADVEASVRRRHREIARRDHLAYLSAVIILSSWAAAIWFMPDLRLLSITGLLIGVWVTWQTYRRSAARLSGASIELPCLVFQRALLERECDFAKSWPKWWLIPIAVGQVAIALTLATNPRFTGSRFFPQGLWLFIATVGGVLAVAWRRYQRQALALQRELEEIDR